MKKKKKQKPWWFALILMAIGAAVGYIGASYFSSGEIKPPSPNGPGIVVTILLILLSFFFVVLIHELGHLIGGLIMGNEFSLVIVGPFKLQKEDGQYHFSINKNIAMAGGLALTLPIEYIYDLGFYQYLYFRVLNQNHIPEASSLIEKWK